VFPVVAARLLLGSAAITLAWCGAMSGIPGMDMPGGWTMSMAWMRMPGQSWTAAAASFLGMWSVMMVAMMLPAFMPMLWRYRLAVVRSARPDSLATRLALGYFAVWILAGALVFAPGVALAQAAMRLPALARAIPLAGGAAILIAGLLQLSRWKARQLECCRTPVMRDCLAAQDAHAAWRHGLRMGLRCCYCCLPMTTVLFVAGVMDLRAMALVTAAVTAERVAPRGHRMARFIGIALVAAGSIYLASNASGWVSWNSP
jgi:predicted metal-binding membrane protein